MIDFHDYCRNCGAILPADNYANARLYCSSDCGEDYRKRQGRMERRAARRGNTCIVCEAPITPDKRGDALYCGPRCAFHLNYARHLGRRRAEARKGRLCAGCGKPVSDIKRAGTKYCRPQCRDQTYYRKRLSTP